MSTAAAEAIRADIYKGMSFADYHALPAVSHSTLEGFVPPRTPAHGRELMLHPKEPTEALALGHALHVAVLEPERYAMEYVVAPKVDRRTNVGKAAWAEFEASAKGKTLLDSDEDARFRAMREAVMSHPMAREFMAGAVAAELSFVWQDAATGLYCKGRLDVMSGVAGDSWIVDLKSCRSAADREFQGAIARYGYGRQAAWYRTGLDALRPCPRRFAFIAVEKDAPFCVACYELDESALEQGERENATALALFQRCQETGNYPGFDSGLGLIALPDWASDARELSEGRS